MSSRQQDDEPLHETRGIQANDGVERAMAGLDEVIARTRDGDEHAFGVLFRVIQPSLLRYLRSLASDEADDLAAEVWVDVVRAIRKVPGDEDGFRAWVFTVARRRAADWRRSESRRPHVSVDETPEPTPATDVADIVECAFSTEQALALIGELPRQQAEIVLLRVVAGLDVGQVAKVVGKRPGTVRVAAHRGLRRLAEILAEREASAPNVTESPRNTTTGHGE